MSRRFVGRSPATRIGVVILVCCLALSAYFTLHELHRWRVGAEAESSRGQALSVAKQAALDLSTLDARTIEQRMTSLLAMSTGEFRQQITSNSASQIQSVRRAKVVSSGRVDSAGIVRCDGRSASVAVALTATVSDQTHKKAQSTLYRVNVHLERKAERWFVDSVEFVQ